MKTILLLLLLLLPPNPTTPTEHIDLIEINHKYDPPGKTNFTQIIYWKKHPQTRKYQVQHWHLAQQPDHYPTKHPILNIWYNNFKDDKNNWHWTKTNQIKETWTHFDPEINNQKIIPTQNRYQLLQKLTPNEKQKLLQPEPPQQ